jgi:NAD(P)-dependent dehydrogenase (short-subunit alcohol dehydrogenase family)
MAQVFPDNAWAVILGGSSGFGLATAHALARQGVNLCVVHRDRRGAMVRIEPEFERIRATGVELLAFNRDALDADVRSGILDALMARLGETGGRVIALLHSIAFGNLKLIVPEAPRERRAPGELAKALAMDPERLQAVVDALFEAGVSELGPMATPARHSSAVLLEEEDFARTVHAMGTSLLAWTQALHARGGFARQAVVLGLTSEGNDIAWKGYAAVSAAKTALEAVSRSIAVELAPYGIRSNIVQPGVTDTPALRLIPGAAHLLAQARLRNPSGRITTPEDVANVLCLLCRPEAAWINGVLLRVDGGEHVAGGWP